MSVAGNTTQAIRAARGDNLATAVTLSRYAGSRAGRLDHNGLACVAPTRKVCGEILGYIQTNDPAIAIVNVVARWLESPEHRKIMLDPSWRWFGVGVKHANNGWYFAVEFAK